MLNETMSPIRSLKNDEPFKIKEINPNFQQPCIPRTRYISKTIYLIYIYIYIYRKMLTNDLKVLVNNLFKKKLWEKKKKKANISNANLD